MASYQGDRGGSGSGEGGLTHSMTFPEARGQRETVFACRLKEVSEVRRNTTERKYEKRGKKACSTSYLGTQQPLGNGDWGTRI